MLLIMMLPSDLFLVLLIGAYPDLSSRGTRYLVPLLHHFSSHFMFHFFG
jgi:hypothetical protein